MQQPVPIRRSAWLAALALGSQAAGAWVSGGLLEAARLHDSAAAFALLAEGAAVDATEADGTTALHWAAYHGDIELTRRLIDAGADVTAANDYGSTPLTEAAVRAEPDLLAALLDAGADADAENADGQTPLMVVARTNRLDAARVLLMHGADVNAVEQRKGQTALMWAAAQSHADMVALLLEHGANPDVRSFAYDWERPVTAEPRVKDIATGGLSALLFASRQGCTACAEALIDAGADIHLTDPETVTPLLMALLNAHYDTARLLLGAGADVNQWDRYGRTPLYAAVDYNTVPHGGRPDLPSSSLTTGVEMIDLLLAAGANPNAQLKLFPPYRSLRADRGADQILGIGATPLIRAARAADVPAIERLLAHGALVDLAQDTGVTALMAAAKMDARSTDTRGKFTTEAELIAAARLLLDAGADVNARDGRGRTALHAAAAQGMADMVQLLAEAGADLLAADENELTPLDYAEGRLGRGGRGSTGELRATTAALLRSWLE